MPPNPHTTETLVLAVLAGTPLETAAAQAPMEPAHLIEAIEAYKAAGRAALEAQADQRDWYQTRIRFTDWDSAERIAAARLGPQLQQAQEAGTIAQWWFLRKHPCWRLRCRPGPKATTTEMTAAVSAVLDTMAADGAVERWWESLYEPEELTFGGPAGMDIAHALFHADSRGTVDCLRHTFGLPNQAAVGRRELSVLLCSTLFRGARQDDNEQADIWHRVVRERPLAAEPSPDQLNGMIPGLRRLISLDTSPTGTLFAVHGPLAFAAEWSEAFAHTGRRLADAARDGTLERGLRGVLASHVIFHWNRLGLPAATQAVLARAARTALLTAPDDRPAP
ncbi:MULTISPECIES: thiopeptide-type bacteriocin biosynthesis protein [Streptomyces]|uniref:thiopeptide-type bacteriocin biosynthesis protein n=1 Tax=Streptomyces TaxID=1883 RepID=UPI002248DF33|nr:thiopeptide-type bacteriocin biosynthesis protein [Streptomyces sp. JHD 1]MCX2968612.1 thiopeptide-type bacteriocin biosynthesis protein [Streptomyces sp. JHD 1]